MHASISGTGRSLLRASALGLLVAGLVFAAPIVALALEADDENADETDPIAALQEQLRQLQDHLDRVDASAAAEIAALNQRIRRLEARLQEMGAGETSGEEDELEALREAAREAAGDQIDVDEGGEHLPVTGGQRSLQRLNPEISVLTDFSYDWSDSAVRDQFVLRAVEFSFQAVLDPYTRFKTFLAAHQELPELEITPSTAGGHDIEIDLEESYIDWVALPGGTSIRVGKFRQRFGTLNRWHEHALASTDVPFALRNLFGAEGLQGVGVGASWGLPGWWATTHNLVVEITNADNDTTFAGGSFDGPAYLLRYTGFYDFGADAYLEIGLTGLLGENDEAGDGRTTVGSIDVNYLWEPAGAGRYRNFEIRAEFIYSEYEDADAPGGGETYEATSFYTYLSWRLSRRFIVGLRYDNAELPVPDIDLASGMFTEGLREEAITPFITFWQSEYVRLRLQYQRAERDFTGPQGPENDNRLWFQVTFAAGPHKHDAY